MLRGTQRRNHRDNIHKKWPLAFHSHSLRTWGHTLLRTIMALAQYFQNHAQTSKMIQLLQHSKRWSTSWRPKASHLRSTWLTIKQQYQWHHSSIPRLTGASGSLLKHHTTTSSQWKKPFKPSRTISLVASHQLNFVVLFNFGTISRHT